MHEIMNKLWSRFIELDAGRSSVPEVRVLFGSVEGYRILFERAFVEIMTEEVLGE